MWYTLTVYDPDYILTNHCLCTCCHKTDILRSQCIIFKESKYNFDNAVVWEALSNRFSIPTSKEYICKKCDKHLLVEKMPINSVASWIRSIWDKPEKNVSTVIVYLQKTF